ncbi:MAG: hypothetical protein NZ923_10860, partial [Candidatus Kryptonium sp.]|nr:hypothetical protein [Candidatus Kryptonium sp.]
MRFKLFRLKDCIVIAHLFQSLTGAIQTWKVMLNALEKWSFQSLTGAIQTKGGKLCTSTSLMSFNPSQVRFKRGKNIGSLQPKKSFNPSQVRFKQIVKYE